METLTAIFFILFRILHFAKSHPNVITELQLCSTFAVNMASLQLCSTAVNMAPLASVLSPLQDPQHPALALTLLHITFTPIAPHYIYTSASAVNMASLQLCSTSVNMASLASVLSPLQDPQHPALKAFNSSQWYECTPSYRMTACHRLFICTYPHVTRSLLQRLR